MNRTAVAAMIAAAAGTAIAQTVQWRVEDGGNGHWYELRLDELSWQAARRAALRAGGDLASLETPTEWHWAAAHFDSGPRWDILVGGVQLPDSAAVDAGWFWLTGVPVEGIPTEFDDNECGFSSPGIENNEQNLLHLSYRGTKVSDINDVVTDARCGAIGEPNTRRWLIEWSADCNADGLVDKGQILAGELVDTNNNGIPDGPSIAVQPTDQSVSVGNAATFIVQVAAAPACTTPVTYQWQRRNPAVADSAAPGAWIDLADDATFSGAQARNLSITNPIPALATGYRCKIGGGCGCEPNPGGFIYTDTVNFNIACPADFNADGGVDFTDVEAFFERWENGC
jgi:hypothetical protein